MTLKNIFLFSLITTASLHAGLLHDAARTNAYWSAKLLIAMGWDVNQDNGNGVTPIFHAAAGGYEGIVRLLLDNGARVDAKDRLNQTCLHYVVRSQTTSVAKLLLERGAKVKAKDFQGNTPLHNAVYNGDLAMSQVLLDYGAQIDARNKKGETSLHRASILHTVAAPLLIYSAAIQGKLEVLLNAKDTSGRTAADLALSWRKNDVYELLTDRSKMNRVIGTALRTRNNVSLYLRQRSLGLNPRLQ